MIEPTVVSKNELNNLESMLLKDRVVFLDEPITPRTASLVIKQLLYLEAQGNKKDIYLYINSPGGSITDGMAIYDTMKYISCDVSTLCVGMAASMGAFLLAAGTPGKRYALPNSEILIHQPLGGGSGQATDVIIMAEHLRKVRERMTRLLGEFTGKHYTEIAADTERDYWMTAQEAFEYKIVDGVKKSRNT